MVELPNAKPSQPLEDAVTQEYFKQYHGQCEDYVTINQKEQQYNNPEYVQHTMISTAQAAKKEKELIVLPPEFSDFTDVFKKPKVPLPPINPLIIPLNLTISLFHVERRTTCSTPRRWKH